MGYLNGQAVIVTGAKGGLGTEVTKAFLDAGAKVAGVSRTIRNEDFPEPGFVAVPSEITSFDAARDAVARAEQHIGTVHTLVHLMGGWAGGQSVAETDDATFENMLSMNLRSAFHMIRAVLPGMQSRKQGRILAIGSKAALEPQQNSGAYSASKAALVSLIRTIALENRSRGITANIVLPGTIDTAANRAAMPNADVRKWVHPAQVAALLVHLASEEAAQVSGAVIPVYGQDL
ncbi:MAG: SDR family NAD(P)-dependent oxidoreductase [Bryobacterales bacterium]|nr:SDR family NAD(P)-dependent oxidoreductase [Bryobacterales bacterium]